MAEPAPDALPNPAPRSDWLATHAEPAVDPDRPAGAGGP